MGEVSPAASAGERWKQVRELFDALCDLPREAWRTELDERCTDPALSEEVFQLLCSQTVGLSRVSSKLDSALAQALAPELDAGERLGPWRLVERIARGGMGTVFKAERADGLYQRTVAIKLLHGLPGPTEVERLASERQVLAGLQLPNVARLYDGGSTPDGYPYLVMEYIDGISLDRYCSEHALNLAQRLRLFLEICAIVQAAHERLVLHCDLKPSNVLIKQNGRPVLLDFGLARLLNDSRDKQESGYCTPGYASPEMMRAQTVGAASDVYSLGVMLVELLSARPCSREPHDLDLPVPLPSQNCADTLRWKRALKGDLDAIAQRACALQANQRYGSVEALMADVRRYLQRRPVTAREGTRLYVLDRAVRRNWRTITAGIGVFSLMAVFLAGLFQARRQAEEEAIVAKQVSDFLVRVFETADPLLRTGRGQEELTSRQLLDKAALQVSHDLEDAPAQLARMRAVLGVAYQNSGVPHQAQSLLQQAYEGFLAPGVQRPVDAAAVLADLSVQATRDGDGARGETLANRGMELLAGHAAPEVLAKLYSAKGNALTNQQHFDSAEGAFNQAMELYRQLPAGKVEIESQEVSYNLALMYWRWGKQAAAERQFRAVLASLKGRRTSMALVVEMRLAQILREQGKFDQALPLLLSGMQHAVGLYGAESSFVLQQHEALADLYQDMGDYPAAEKEYQQLQQLSARIDGADSVGYSMGLFNHGALREEQGDVINAEALYRQAWAIRRDKLGDDAPTSMRAEVGLGRLLTEQGRMQEAGQLLLHADRGMSAALPADAPGRLEARLELVNWHVRQRELETARALLAETDTTAAPDFLLLRLLAIQADLAEREGVHERALAKRRSALELSQSLYGDEKVVTARYRLALAQTLLQLGHPKLALAELQHAGPVLSRYLLEGSAEVRKVKGLSLLARSHLQAAGS
ncbi:MAG: protein kinase domain-containing protein [Stenotrophomonas sp.]